ncbi:MAG: hypothetical protein AAF962_00060 [Actinomycetota bacterium]
MGEVVADGPLVGARALARAAEPFHAITYYSREMSDLRDVGYKGWWHAYFGYRPAPMGAVGASVVTATFYNFAPRMVERAVPGVWAINTPEQALTIRRERVDAALARIYADDRFAPLLAEGADLVRTATAGCDIGARPLTAAHLDLDWPAGPASVLWHGCTLLREHRGESHNLALAAAGVDPVASHVLMAGRGHGNRVTIQSIRGWTDDEWAAAVGGLAERGWAEADGTLTEAGSAARSAIEAHTDELSSGPLRAVGGDLDRLLAALQALDEHLLVTGEVSGRWPPEHLMQADRH